MNMIEELQIRSGALKPPENYYRGRCLPENLVLPDSILLFYSTWNVTASQSHARYLLVVPFRPMVYYVEQSRFELNPGMGLFVAPWKQHCHQAAAQSNMNDRLLITFELPSNQCYLPESPLVNFSPRAWEYVAGLLDLYPGPDVLALSYQLTRLLSELADHSIAEERAELSPAVAASIHFIARHIEQALDIQLVADELKLSPSHLRMRFRREMGVSLGRYITEQRLNLACGKLANSTCQVQEIAAGCGYASIHAFGHFFKNLTGVSPLQFRKQARAARVNSLKTRPDASAGHTS